MKSSIAVVRRMLLVAGVGWLAALALSASAQTNGTFRIVEASGVVEVLPHNATDWVRVGADTDLHPPVRVRTRANSTMAILMADNSVVRWPALSEVEIQPPTAAEGPGLRLLQGMFSFFHRDKPGRVHTISSGGVAGIKGTEFVVALTTVNGVEQTTLSVIDGEVAFSNEGVSVSVTNDQQIVSAPGQAPRRTPGFAANNLLQWCFYYPGVLDPDELPLTAAEKTKLAESLAAYRTGDLLAALGKYPNAQPPGSDAERVYLAALQLASGQVTPAEETLSALTATGVAERNQRLAGALRTLIAAVKRAERPSTLDPQLSTEFLAASYYEQSLAWPDSLAKALVLARRATTNSPNFGFARERVAELEFSFGRIDRAQTELKAALRLSPRNAQALALQGFLLAAQNKTRAAIASFNGALAVDGSLGNAWLGRGLCKIHQGSAKAGREDLVIAAAMEPDRAALRSYLGKAYGDAGDTKRATHELNLAKKLDKHDPTAWLYSALLNEQDNHINEAVHDLEKSQTLNNNRSVYRSSLLLDQDSAVRSANLARIYQEAGMDEVAVTEATRAVNTDYANYSAHLFLANSYNELRDPNQINLRYETPTYVEFLVGNLLAPVNAGVLSPTISQQEYSQLFAHNQLGVISETEYLSRGAWTESGAQFGTVGNFSYDFEGFYRNDPGQRPNNDIEQRQLSLTVKQQLTPNDSLYASVLQYDGSGGDLRQYYYQTNADLGLRTHETQDPIVLAGYHHQWGPGSHTLLLAGRLEDTYEVQDAQSPILAFSQRVPGGPIRGVTGTTANQDYSSTTTIYTAELQQIVEQNENCFIGGVRYQDGTFDTQNNLSHAQDFSLLPRPAYALDQSYDEHFQRLSAYGYYLWQMLESLQLTAGLSYDWLTYPQNFRSSPISGGQQTEGQLSPKAGVIWKPFCNTTLRAAYTQSLGGASLEQSYQLEPSQVAGFNQLFRSLIPESVQGENAGAKFDTYNLALDQKFGHGTYLELAVQRLNSTVDHQSGVMVVGRQTYPSTTPEHLDYDESRLLVTLDQLLGKYWSAGVNYQLTDAKLLDEFTQVPQKFQLNQSTSALLNQVAMHVQFNHSSGFFSQFQALWTDQHNSGYSPAEPGEAFWQLNVFAGYRFPRRHAELTVGLLNLTGQNYQLNPLNAVNELPRSRTLMVRFKLNF